LGGGYELEERWEEGVEVWEGWFFTLLNLTGVVNPSSTRHKKVPGEGRCE
jgi:hypothetical protein